LKRDQFDFDPQDFLREVSEAIDVEGTELSLPDFVRHELNLGIELSTGQWAVLKAFYGLPLTEAETALLELWALEGRTTWNPDTQRCQMLVLECGRRSGKSTLASIIAAYEFYRLARLPCPQAHYGIALSTKIAILVMATTAEQGKDTIFGAVAGAIQNCRYFQRLIERKEVLVGKEQIEYPAKRLHIRPGNSKSASQVGYTIKCLIMDEVARFRDADGASNALEIWSNVGIGSAPFGHEALRVAISSAWYEGDAIQRLYEACGRMPGMLGFRLRSWDLNPVYAARDNPVIAAEYATDPIRAALEFEGLRSSGEGSFLSGNLVDRATRGQATIQARPSSANGLSTVSLDRLDSTQRGLYVHLDPSISTDTYAAALAHGEYQDGRLVVVIDGLLGWEPGPGREVSITNVCETLFELHRRVQLKQVSSDHYGTSLETLQRLSQAGIAVKRIFFSAGLQLSMYEYLRRLLSEDRLILPCNSWWTPTLVRELKHLILVRGRRVDHPRGGSKDFADAVAALAWEIGRKGITNQVSGSPRMQRFDTHRKWPFHRRRLG